MALGRRSPSWRETTFVALDVEATSADPRSAVPLSVGWVPVRAGRVVPAAGGYTLVRPPSGVRPDEAETVEALRVHRLLPEEVEAGADAASVGATLRDVLADAVLLAHGADLERAVLRGWGVPVGRVVDTLAVVRRLDERAGRPRASPRLPDVARRWALPPLTAHHAHTDALTTALLLVALADDVERERGACTLRDLELLGR